jgi:hypothetical protein
MWLIIISTDTWAVRMPCIPSTRLIKTGSLFFLILIK